MIQGGEGIETWSDFLMDPVPEVLAGLEQSARMNRRNNVSHMQIMVLIIMIYSFSGLNIQNKNRVRKYFWIFQIKIILVFEAVIFCNFAPSF